MELSIINKRVHLFIYMLFILLLTNTSIAEDVNDVGQRDLFDMSLTELMAIDVKIPATITEKNPLKIPASVTTITAEDIELTPARNLLDLLEIYVPGAFYEVHVAGFQPGIRGIIADRPYKFLVNINGININIKAIYGAQLELVNWDLDDIEKIEIIRGPGSVTYGPGAIGGVINITTKRPKEDMVTWKAKYWDEYDSIVNNISFSHLGESAEVYGFLSVVGTQGHKPDIYEVTSTGGRYKPHPADYLADYHGQPQVKAHVDAHFKNNWRFWARYNAANSMRWYDKYEVSPGNWQNFRAIRFRYFQTALENFRPLSDAWSLKQLYGLGSIETHIVERYSTSLADNDPESLLNSSMWSENRAFARLMFQYEEETSPIKAAVGAEISYDMIRPEWGDSADTGLRIGGIISGPGSEAYGTGTYQVNESSADYHPEGSGWETYIMSPMAELNWTLNDRDTLLFSGRADKHSYTNWMFSPRAAWIRQFNQDTFFKLIGQRSVRMNAQEELFFNHANNQKNKPEVLHAVEAIYNTKTGPHLSWMGSVFWNHLEAIAFNGGQIRTTPVGTLQSAGLELESKYQKDDLTVGLNHSYVQQIDYDADPVDPADPTYKYSGISFSDYYRVARDDPNVIITSNGNNIANWPNHATKFYLNKRFHDGRYTFHVDLVTFWGFEGEKDGLDALEAAGGDSASIADVRKKDVHEIRMTANLSLACKLAKTSTLILYLQNIPVIGDNKRYGYNSGYVDSYPNKVIWIEEPMVFGLSYLLKF